MINEDEVIHQIMGQIGNVIEGMPVIDSLKRHALFSVLEAPKSCLTNTLVISFLTCMLLLQFSYSFEFVRKNMEISLFVGPC